jgi:S-formylglutathione hydrolase FrmB
MALFHVRYYSELNSYDTDMDVILPSIQKKDKYPVLFLLHDLGGNQTFWQRHTAIECYAEDRGLMVVMPSGLNRWYTDVNLAGGFFDNYHRFFVYELISTCRSFFSEISPYPELHFVGGAGMGGYGALKLALAHPVEYGAAFSIDGCTDIVKRLYTAKDIPETAWFADIFGNLAEVSGSNDDLFALVNKSKSKAKYFLSCNVNNIYLKENHALVELMVKAGFDVNLVEVSLKSSWPQAWDDQLKEIIYRLPMEI